VWSGDVYLQMTVSCPDGAQTVGGAADMEAPINSTGPCQATVSEPTSENTAVTFDISGPNGA
jgi:hypothetical protein